MRLRVSTPTRTLLERDEVAQVVAPGRHGRFGMLPNHVDFVAVLEPGLLAYDVPAGDRRYLAVDGGLLVKQGPHVRVSTRRGYEGPDLEDLERTIEERYRQLTERERKARTALAKLEASLIRRLTSGGRRAGP